MEARADNWQNASQVIPWRRCRRKSRFWKNAPARKFINIPKIGGNCKTWKTISTSSVCLWRYLPSKAKANVWGQNLNCCDLLVSANFPWLCIVRRAKKKKVLFATQLADFPTFSSSLGVWWCWCFLCCKLERILYTLLSYRIPANRQIYILLHNVRVINGWSGFQDAPSCTVTHVIFQI